MLLKKTDALILAYVVQSSVDSSRRYWTRKLIQNNVRPPCGEQWNMCRGKRKSSYKTTTVSPSPEGLPIRNENLLASYRLPRRSVAAAAHFESNRMVPTGPNPLHNSNRSQVIFPWHNPWWYGLGVTQFFFCCLDKTFNRHPVTLPTNKHEGFASWRQNELHEEDDEDDHQLAVMWVENFDDKGMTATRHIIGLGNWRWWAFMPKWETTHGAAAAHTYMYVSLRIMMRFEATKSSPLDSSCCCCWPTPLYVDDVLGGNIDELLPNVSWFLCTNLMGVACPPSFFHHHLSKRTRICSSQLRFCEVRAPTLVNWLASNPESNSVLNYNHTLICPRTLLDEEIFWCITLWTLLRGTHALYYHIKLLPPLMMMNDATWNSSTQHKLAPEHHAFDKKVYRNLRSS